MLFFKGLVGYPRVFAVLKNALLPPSSIAPRKLLLCPGTLRMGESSSTSFNLAVALAIPHAGVGLSSGGEDDLPESD